MDEMALAVGAKIRLDAGGGVFLTVPVCYEKILGELQNIHARMRKEIKKTTFSSKSGETLIASGRLNLIEVVHFTSVPACSSVSF